MRQMGPYQIVREIGRGGMGVVFEAVRPESGERLALKVLLEASSPEARQRFAREAELLRFIGRHPNAVSFRDSGEIQGLPYLAMEFIDGETLQAQLERGVEMRTAIRALVEVSRAVHFAHEAGVVHRDLKPQNILVDASGQARVSDLGVARDLRAQSLTQTGMRLGTVAYMAPEQVESGKAVDRRSDVYALGAILYRVLAGRVAFEGSDLSAVKKILLDSPEPPSHLAPGVPPELEDLTLRALSKEPGDRPPSAEAFAASLEAWLDGRGAFAGVRRRGVPIVAGLAGALLVGVLAFSGGYAMPRARPESDESGKEPQEDPSQRLALIVARLQAGQAVSDLLPAATGDEDGPPADVHSVPADWMALARVESARLEGRWDAVLDATATWPPRPFVVLVRAEALLAQGKRSDALPHLDQAKLRLAEGDILPVPWRPGSLRDRWTWLADLFERAGRPADAARAMVDAVDGAQEEDEEAVYLLERAGDLDLDTVLGAGQHAARFHAWGLRILREEAESELPHPGRIRRARTLLLWTRLMEPARSLAPALDPWIRLSQHKITEVHQAIRPWAYTWTYPTPHTRNSILQTEVDGLLRDGATTEVWNPIWWQVRVPRTVTDDDRHAISDKYEALVEWTIFAPEQPTNWHLLGLYATNLGRMEIATRALRVVVDRTEERAASGEVLSPEKRSELESKRVLYPFDLSRAYLRRGRVEDARRLLQQSIELQPQGTDPNAMALAANVCLRRKDPTAAHQQLDILQLNAPNTYNTAKIRRMRAEAYYLEGKMADYKKTMEAAGPLVW